MSKTPSKHEYQLTQVASAKTDKARFRLRQKLGELRLRLIRSGVDEPAAEIDVIRHEAISEEQFDISDILSKAYFFDEDDELADIISLAMCALDDFPFDIPPSQLPQFRANWRKYIQTEPPKELDRHGRR
jgi:hypothetical protein